MESIYLIYEYQSSAETGAPLAENLSFIFDNQFSFNYTSNEKNDNKVKQVIKTWNWSNTIFSYQYMCSNVSVCPQDKLICKS